MKFKFLSVLMLAGMSFTTQAQQVTVSPLPQEITWGAKAFDAGFSYTLSGEQDADTDALRVLKAKVPQGSGSAVNIVIGERGDAAVESCEIEDLVGNDFQQGPGNPERTTGFHRDDGDAVNATLFTEEPFFTVCPCFGRIETVEIHQGVPFFHGCPVLTVFYDEGGIGIVAAGGHESGLVVETEAVSHAFGQFHAAGLQGTTVVVGTCPQV